MVRKVRRLSALACALFCLAALPLAASAASIYDGNISTTYVTFFRDMASKLPMGTDYVFFRSGQYEYCMVAGDLTWDGSMFTGSDLTQYLLVYNSSYNSTYQFGTTALDTFSLATGGALVYSNLGNFPDLYERSDNIMGTLLFMMAVLTVMMIIRPIFSFTLRLRIGEGST